MQLLALRSHLGRACGTGWHQLELSLGRQLHLLLRRAHGIHASHSILDKVSLLCHAHLLLLRLLWSEDLLEQLRLAMGWGWLLDQLRLAVGWGWLLDQLWLAVGWGRLLDQLRLGVG